MAFISKYRIDVPVSEMTPEQRRAYNNERSKAAYYRRRASKEVRNIADHLKFMTDLAYAVHHRHGDDTPRVMHDLVNRALNSIAADHAKLIDSVRKYTQNDVKNSNKYPVRFDHHVTGSFWYYQGQKLTPEQAEPLERAWLAGEPLPEFNL